MSQHNGERREFFRIDDDIYLDYRPLTEEDYRERLAIALQEPQPEADNVGLQLQALTAQAGTVLAQIRKRDSEIGQYLALIDRKIELLGRALIGSQIGAQIDGVLNPNAHVNLSGGGLAFHAPTGLQPDVKLELKLLLFPAHIFIHCIGRVVYCRHDGPDSAKPYRLGVEFTRISEIARDALVRHTLELQSAQLRRSKT